MHECAVVMCNDNSDSQPISFYAMKYVSRKMSLPRLDVFLMRSRRHKYNDLFHVKHWQCSNQRQIAYGLVYGIINASIHSLYA